MIQSVSSSYPAPAHRCRHTLMACNAQRCCERVACVNFFGAATILSAPPWYWTLPATLYLFWQWVFVQSEWLTSWELVVFMINGWDSEYAHRTVLGHRFLALQRTSLVTILVSNSCDHISSSKLVQTNLLQVGV